MWRLSQTGKDVYKRQDKDLVFHTALAALFPVFLLVVLLFHIRQIAGTNWQEVSLSQIIQDVNIPYLLFSMGVAGLVCLTAVLLFWRYRRDEVKQLIHLSLIHIFCKIRKRSDLFPKKYKHHQRLHNFLSWQEHLHPVYDMWWLIFHHNY